MAIKFIDLLNIIIITICLMILYINKINIWSICEKILFYIVSFFVMNNQLDDNCINDWTFFWDFFKWYLEKIFLLTLEKLIWTAKNFC
jgi:hypothetical protein